MKFKLINKISEWILYNICKTYWVYYTPKRHVGGMYPQGDSYLTCDGGWSFDLKEAKRFWKYEHTPNRWTRSKKVTID